jgi:hypothetical protein
MGKSLVRVGIVSSSLLVGAGVVGAISYFTRERICVPPTMPEKCPPNPTLPPAGYKPWQGAVPSEMVVAAKQSLAYPIGTWLSASGYGIMLEWHYHPPCGELKPWGCHKGATVYRKVL